MLCSVLLLIRDDVEGNQPSGECAGCEVDERGDTSRVPVPDRLLNLLDNWKGGGCDVTYIRLD